MHVVLITTLYPAQENEQGKYGYITTALHNFVKYWKYNCSVTVIKPDIFAFRRIFDYIRKSLSSKNRKDHYSIDGIKVYKCNILRYPKINRFWDRKIYKVIQKQTKPDAVVSHMKESHLFAMKLSNKIGATHIVGMHASDLSYLEKKRIRMYEKILENSSGIVCRSDSIRKKIISRNPVLENKCFTAYSGIDESIIEPISWIRNKCEMFGIEKKLKFISVCTLLRLKNIDINLKALCKLGRNDWEYRIVGDGPERDYLHNLATELGLSERVRFLGHCPRDCVIEELKESNVFIMVSSPETFGLAYLEAMAKGNIVVGSIGWGIEGFIRNKESGFLCEPGSENALIETLTEIMELKKDRVKDILEKQFKLISRFTEENAANRYLEFIMETIGKNRQSEQYPVSYNE